MRKCRETTTEDPKAKHYIDILMSSVEYDTFVKLMRIMRPVAAQRAALKADMKGSEAKGGDGGDEPPPSASKAAKGDTSRYEEDSAADHSGGARSPTARAEGKFSEDEDRSGPGSKMGAK